MLNERIGVYICRCGGNISDYVDVEAVKRNVEKIPGVVLTKVMMFTCSDSAQEEIINDIKDNHLDAIVVASCSPKLHQHTFRKVAERAGLNKYKYIQANIREQVSWAHSDNPKGATEKATNVIKGAINRARLATDLMPIEIQSNSSVAIIGGGVSGLTAALQFSDLGINVYLIEKSPFIGGRILQWSQIYPTGDNGKYLLSNIINEIKKRQNITIFTNAELIEKFGSVGDFTIKIKIHPRFVVKNSDHFEEAIQKCPVSYPDDFNFGLTERKAIYRMPEGAYPELPVIDAKICTKCGECAKICGDAINLDQKEDIVTLKVGAILVTTGFDPYTPASNEFGYGSTKYVITLPQLERILSLNEKQKDLVFENKRIENIVFIYCVGSRQKKEEGKRVNEYCSRYCCTSAIFTSLELLKKYPQMRIFHLFRDIRTYGKNELFYDEASRKGIIFIKYDDNNPPKVIPNKDDLIVSVNDILTDNELLEIQTDLVVLVTGMVPRNNEDLTKVLKIPTGRDGFYNEIHPKLKPVETVIGGVYIAGTAQGPKNVQESVSSALSAVSKASSFLLKGKVELEPNIANVDTNLCIWCNKCFEACPYGAITKVSKGDKEVANVLSGLCKGCGACVPVCPNDAIQILGYTDEEILGMIKGMANKEGGVL
ncbi:MAG TPA: CoB--CoM heterodisulfide reductase iron-sulfur subunit A family protein [Euryarchaeota archaeon]|nr:CoB--CoM heterodisulfide reductase iron-sulfur subunit A family protein [Euryarchaeota archaeon]